MFFSSSRGASVLELCFLWDAAGIRSDNQLGGVVSAKWLRGIAYAANRRRRHHWLLRNGGPRILHDFCENV